MFTLLSDIYSTLTRRPEFSLLILGLDNAGKTTLLEQLKVRYPLHARSSSASTTTTTTRTGEQPTINVSKITPTIGQNIGRIMVAGTKFKVWDLGGQASLRELWTRYYSFAHLVVFVLDASSRDRFQESCSVLTTLLTTLGHRTTDVHDDALTTFNGRGETGGEAAGSDLHSVPVLLLANKSDIEGSMSTTEVKESLNLQILQYLSPKEGGVLACSALTGDGLEKVTQWIVKSVLKNQHDRPPVMT